MNYIISNTYSLPNGIVEQNIIFSKQLEKYIYPKKLVAVLSSFPIFLHDYYGNKEIIRKIK